MSIYPQYDNDYQERLDIMPARGTNTGLFFHQLADTLKWPVEHLTAVPGDPQLVLEQLGVKPGDYVILPNLSPLYWAEAVQAIGAKGILIDHDPDHWQLDLDLLEEFLMHYTMLNERDELILKKDARVIRALLVPHLLGGMCDMDRLAFIAMRFNLPCGEDISQAMGSSWKDQPAGSFGSVNYLDFSANPILPFGEPVLFSTQKRDLPARETESGPAAAMKNQRGSQLVPAVPAIVERFRRFESIYRQTDQRKQLQWMRLLPDNRGNGLSAAFTGRIGSTQVLPTGRLQPPLYENKPFSKSLYIRRENWSAKITQQAILLPLNLREDELAEKMKRLLSEQV